MIVVSDTSPLNYLVLVEAVGVLPTLFSEICAPPIVIQELLHPKTPAEVRQWALSPPGWLQVIAPTQDAVILEQLDPGEAQAIALAIELRADAVLIDEKKGRSIAKSHGLVTIGTITILELAAKQKLIELPTVFNALEKTSFQIQRSYLDAALERDAARKTR